MASVEVSAERRIDAPADTVYGCLADFRQHHPRFLPPEFTDFEVESGGVGAGTVTTFTLRTRSRTRSFRMAVSEPEPGRVLVESDTGSSLVTTFTVAPENGASRVRIATSWQGAKGVGGFFERRFAPKALRAIYEDELRRLDEYARQLAAGDEPDPKAPTSG